MKHKPSGGRGMERITIKALNAVVKRINVATGSPETPYSVSGKANIGNYHISQEYGGYALYRMNNEGGGVTTPIGGGHCPARDLYSRMQAYLCGLSEGGKGMNTTNTHGMRITGHAAIEYAEQNGLTLNKYADPTEDARVGLTVD